MTFYLFWSGLIFRGICVCTAGIPALFAAAAFPYWEFLTANGRCTWGLKVRLDTDFPSMAHGTPVLYLRVNSQPYFCHLRVSQEWQPGCEVVLESQQYILSSTLPRVLCSGIVPGYSW